MPAAPCKKQREIHSKIIFASFKVFALNEYKILPNGNLKVTIPLQLHGTARRTRILVSGEKPETSAIALQIARAFRWQQFIDDGRFTSAAELAKTVKRNASFVTRILRLTRLSPRIIHPALVDKLPPKVNQEALYGVLPELWAAQERELGFPAE